MPASSYEIELRQFFGLSARHRNCAVCGAPGRKFYIEAHHIIYQQELRRQLSDKGSDAYAERMWDVRNMLPLCRLCHARHHNARRRVTMEEVRQNAPRAWQFAATVGCGWFIGRHYDGPTERRNHEGIAEVPTGRRAVAAGAVPGMAD